MASDGFQVSGSLMWVLTRISDERVPSILSELRLGFLFLFIRENILSSPAFEWGWSLPLQLHEITIQIWFEMFQAP